MTSAVEPGFSMWRSFSVGLMRKGSKRRPARVAGGVRASLLIASLVCTGLVTAGGKIAYALEQTYLLGVDDVAHIRVGQWRATEGVFDAWAGMSGEYTVGPDGTLSVPIAGTLQVKGKTTSQVAEVVSNRLQVEIGLPNPPAVSVEIASYGPVYVTGDVAEPGKYEFRPGMTVQQAIALAGGHSRSILGESTSERNVLNAHGRRRQLIYRQGLVLLRIARLEAEIEGADEYEVSEELLRLEGLETDAEVQEKLFDANEQTLRMKLQSVDELIELLENQMTKLEAQLELINREIERAEEDMADKERLRERGLALASSESAVARTLADLRLREIQLTVERLNIQQDLNAAKREDQDIRNERKIELLNELEKARRELREIDIEIDTQTALFSEAISSGATAAPLMPELHSVRIVRPDSSGGDAESFPAGPMTALRPRDTIVVKVALVSDESTVGQ